MQRGTFLAIRRCPHQSVLFVNSEKTSGRNLYTSCSLLFVQSQKHISMTEDYSSDQENVLLLNRDKCPPVFLLIELFHKDSSSCITNDFCHYFMYIILLMISACTRLSLPLSLHSTLTKSLSRCE